MDTSRIDAYLKTIRARSQGVRKRLDEILYAIRNDPATGKPAGFVPADIQQLAQEHRATIRIAKVINPPHDFRIIYIHFPEDDLVDCVLAFERKTGYSALDWAAIAESIQQAEPGPH